LTIQQDSESPIAAAEFFEVPEPSLERWSFSWFEDLYAHDEKRPSVVNVTSKAYRNLHLGDPGTYTVTLNYDNGKKTRAKWTVRDLPKKRRAKNIILFIGDGMTTNMITAARLIAHKSINGVYQSKMQLDQFPVLGHQMTHSIDSFITDSANSATALYSGHKSTANCLGVYADSSPDKFDDPKVESIAEIFQRVWRGSVGIVSTAYLADATPGALTAHTRDRQKSDFVIDSLLNGVQKYPWTNWSGPDVLFGGGATNFFNSSLGGKTFKDKDYYAEFRKRGYKLALDRTQLQGLPSEDRALGVFHVSTMSTVRFPTETCRQLNICLSGSIETSIGRILRDSQMRQTAPRAMP
jgi:alkaline phosphatase